MLLSNMPQKGRFLNSFMLGDAEITMDQPVSLSNKHHRTQVSVLTWVTEVGKHREMERDTYFGFIMLLLQGYTNFYLSYIE